MKQALAVILAIVVIFILLGRMGIERGAGKTDIEFWCYGSGGANNPCGEFWMETGRLFEKANPGVRVKVVSDIPHNPYFSVLTSRFLGGKAPDVFIVDDGVISELANEDQLMPLEDFIHNDKVYRAEDFPASMVQDGYVGGKRYSIPWNGAGGCIYYRTDIFAAAGVEPPKTWEDLLIVCRALQEKAGLKYPLALFPTQAFWMMPWVWQNEARIFSPDLKRVVIDSPEFIEAVQFVHDLMYKHGVVDPTLAMGTKHPDLWSTGQAAMIIDGTWRIARTDILFPHLKGKWEVALVPGQKKQVSFFGGEHLVMNRHSRHADLAWKFMVFATQPENQFRWAEIGDAPGNLKTLQMPAFKEKYPHFAIIGDMMRYARNNPFAPFFNDIWYTRFQNGVLQRVMKEPEADIAKVMRQAVVEMQKIVDDYWKVHDYAAYRMQGVKPKDDGS